MLDDEVVPDDELAAEALAADPDAALPDDAVPFAMAVAGSSELLPTWYMPAPAVGVSARAGWRRRIAVGVIGAFVVVNAAGLCTTYGFS